MIAIDNQSSTNKYAVCCVLDRLVKELTLDQVPSGMTPLYDLQYINS